MKKQTTPQVLIPVKRVIWDKSAGYPSAGSENTRDTARGLITELIAAANVTVGFNESGYDGYILTTKGSAVTLSISTTSPGSFGGYTTDGIQILAKYYGLKFLRGLKIDKTDHISVTAFAAKFAEVWEKYLEFVEKEKADRIASNKAEVEKAERATNAAQGLKFLQEYGFEGKTSYDYKERADYTQQKGQLAYIQGATTQQVAGGSLPYTFKLVLDKITPAQLAGIQAVISGYSEEEPNVLP